MKSVMKRALSLLLALVLLTSLLPVGAVNAQALGLNIMRPCQGAYLTMSSADTGSVVEITYLPEPDSADFMMQSTTDKSAYLPIEEAAAEAREQMVARNEQFAVYIRADHTDYEAMFDDLVEATFAHTGVPTEGDYLERQRGRWDVSISAWTDGTGTYYCTFTNTLPYFVTAEQEAAVDEAVDALLQELNVYQKSDYEKVKAIYDWICANVTYDYENLTDTEYMRKYTAYAALIDRTAVCQGYAVLFYRLALELGVDARYISGIGGGGAHGWNIVELDDLYYNLDATWDAGHTTYSYFLRCDGLFDDHTRNDKYTTEEFYTAYPMGQTDYTPTQQTCSHESYRNYYAYDPTCTEWGMEAYWECIDCGKYFRNAERTQQVELGELYIAPYGHDYVDDVCSRCGDTLEVKVIAEGTCGEKLTWMLTSDGMLTVKGSGDMDNFEMYGSPWYAYCDQIIEVTLPEGLTSIGRFAFQDTNLTTIAIPETVVTFTDYAFYACRKLTTITIPASVSSVEVYAFACCDSLTEIVVDESNAWYTSKNGVLYSKDMQKLVCYPTSKKDELFIVEYGVSTICAGAFNGNKYLTYLSIMGSVDSILIGAFHGCSSLTTVAIPSSVTIIANNVFSYCGALNHIRFEGTQAQWDAITKGATWDAEAGDYTIYFVCDSEGHKWMEATCTTAKTCEVCGTTEGEANGHNYEGSREWVQSEPTCTTPGDMEIEIYCTACNTPLSGNFRNIDPLGHSFVDDICSVCGAEKVLTGACGDTATWTFDEAIGTLIISGTGDTYYYRYYGYFFGWGDYTPWFTFAKQITSVVIGEGITSIGAEFFYGCENLTAFYILSETVAAALTDEYACADLPAYAHDIYFPETITSIPEFVVKNYTEVASVCLDGVTYNRYRRHLRDTLVEKVAPTCTEDGYTKWLCRCGAESTVVLAAIGHDLETLIEEVAPSCTIDGYQKWQCHCGAESTVVLAATGHRYQMLEKVAPSCTTAGYQKWQCHCGEESTVVLPATGHDFKTLLDEVAPSCTTAGYQKWQCHCGEESTVVLPALGHSLSDGSCKEERICKSCGKTNGFGYHSYADDACTICGVKVIDQGTCGDDLTWTFNADGELSLYGTGAMYDYLYDLQAPIPWAQYAEEILSVEIADTVTRIDHYAFAGCTALTTVTIPASVTELGGLSFMGCTNLQSVVLCGELEKFWSGVFRDCTSLTDVYVHSTVMATKAHYNLWRVFELTQYVERFYVLSSIGAMHETFTQGFCCNVPVESVEVDGTAYMLYKRGEHVYEETAYTAPTCTTSGSITHTCTVCAHVNKENINATGHNWDDEYVCTNCGDAPEYLIGCGLELEDLILSEDGIYYTQAGYPVMIAVSAPIDHLGGMSLAECVSSYGENYLSLTYWEQLVGASNEEGYAPLNEQTLVWILDVITGNPAWGEDETYLTNYIGVYVDRNHVHEYTSVVTAPTCTEAGYATYTCSGCGDTYREEIPATGHTFGAWEPSGKDETKHIRHCACGTTQQSSHDYDDGVVTKEATHTEVGIKTFTCADCGYSYDEELPTTEEHSWSEWVVSEKDETKHVRHCACGTTQQSSHDYDDGVVTKEATHTEVGMKTFTCVDCGHSYGEELPTTEEHSWSEWVVSEKDETKHVRHCACGTTQQSVHSYDDGVVTKEATHEEAGIKTFTCTVCSYAYEEELPAMGHTYGEWKPSEKDDCSHYRECDCGAAQATDCKFDGGTITQMPTLTEEGQKCYTCALCGREKFETMPALEPTNELVTEDESAKLVVGEDSEALIDKNTVLVVDPIEEEQKEAIVETAKENIVVVGGENSEVVYAYDISLLLDGIEVQPGGDVEITLPQTIDTTLYTDVVVVYIDDEGNVHPCQTTVNADGSITFITDHFSCYVVISTPIVPPAFTYGDASGDGKVDGADLLILRKYIANYDYDTETSDVEVGEGADANGDGRIDGGDLLLLRKYIANFDYDTGTSDVILGPQN